VLDTFATHEVGATSFVEGHKVVDDPELVRRAADEGHEVANHVLADLNGDGAESLLSFHDNGSWWMTNDDGDGALSFTRGTEFTTASGWQTHVVGDVSGDGTAGVVSFTTTAAGGTRAPARTATSCGRGSPSTPRARVGWTTSPST
jgi:hypothetical protein